MAEDIGTLVAARALVDHLGGHCMAEEMAGDARGDHETGAGKCLPHDGPDRRTGQRPQRWPTAHTDLATRTLRPSALSVGHDGLADIVGEG
jgi:hypothetical protein